jgi:excisionase family DNA binding protein
VNLYHDEAAIVLSGYNDSVGLGAHQSRRRVVRSEGDAVKEKPPRILLSVGEAAEYLGISAGTLRNWISMRRIEYVKVGRLTRITQAALDRYVAANTVRAVEEQ